jgi:zinc protease
MLTDGESARLHRALVYEQQLAQSVEGFADLREDLGLVIFKVVLASGQAPRKVELACFKELDRLLAEPPGAAELAKAKNRLLAGRLAERETNEGKSIALARAAVLLHDAARVDRDPVQLQAITADQVHDALKKVLTARNRLVLEVVPGSGKAAKKGVEE